MSELPKIMGHPVDYDEALQDDPYLGYSSLEEAQADCKGSSQLEVFARLINRENVFVSGIAGSGKSSIVRPFIEFVRQKFPEKTVAVVAPTGAAAANIDGSTLHRWAGIISTKEGVRFVNGSAMSDTDVLIIDEISMLPAYLFQGLDEAMRRAKRRWKEPFGGAQVVLMGDFMQLPPVPVDGEDSRFAIFSKAWKELSPSYCFIDKVRRAEDLRLQKVLSAITREQVNTEVRELINTRVNAPKTPGKTYVNLYTTNRRIEEHNKRELAKIQSASVEYTPETIVLQPNHEKAIQATIRKLDIANGIELKVGCPVILTKNTYYEETLYPNGSVGKVEEASKRHVLVRFNDGSSHYVRRVQTEVTANVKEERVIRGKKVSVTTEEVVGYVHYMPLKLGYATSVHKSQGKTCDGVVADLGNIFTPGLGYVALSRVRSLDDLIISNVNEKIYSVDPASSKVTMLVKRAAVKGRREFIEKADDYSALLTNSFSRLAVWATD